MEKKRAPLLWIGFLVALALLAIAPGLWWFSPAQQQHRRNSRLVAACTAGDVKAVQDALPGADVDARDGYGISPLMYAARGDHPDMRHPAATDNPDVVQLLLENGAKVNAATDSGFVALFWAARYGHKEVVKVLIEKGADVNAKDKDGMTALKWANTNQGASPPNYETVIAVLKEAGATE
jgi:ankyrin repeat protein